LPTKYTPTFIISLLERAPMPSDDADVEASHLYFERALEENQRKQTELLGQAIEMNPNNTMAATVLSNRWKPAIQRQCMVECVRVQLAILQDVRDSGDLFELSKRIWVCRQQIYMFLMILIEQELMNEAIEQCVSLIEPGIDELSLSILLAYLYIANDSAKQAEDVLANIPMPPSNKGHFYFANLLVSLLNGDELSALRFTQKVKEHPVALRDIFSIISEFSEERDLAEMPAPPKRSEDADIMLFAYIKVPNTQAWLEQHIFPSEGPKLGCLQEIKAFESPHQQPFPYNAIREAIGMAEISRPALMIVLEDLTRSSLLFPTATRAWFQQIFLMLLAEIGGSDMVRPIHLLYRSFCDLDIDDPYSEFTITVLPGLVARAIHVAAQEGDEVLEQTLAEVSSMAYDRSIQPYARCSAILSLAIAVEDRDISEQHAKRFAEAWFSKAPHSPDCEVWLDVVNLCNTLGFNEFKPQIKDAFKAGTVYEEYVGAGAEILSEFGTKKLFGLRFKGTEASLRKEEECMNETITEVIDEEWLGDHPGMNAGVLHPFDIPYQRELPKVGRNAPCPCGSGKKYKKCCL